MYLNVCSPGKLGDLNVCISMYAHLVSLEISIQRSCECTFVYVSVSVCKSLSMHVCQALP